MGKSRRRVSERPRHPTHWRRCLLEREKKKEKKLLKVTNAYHLFPQGDRRHSWYNTQLTFPVLAGSLEWPLYNPKDAYERLTPQVSAFPTKKLFDAAKETNGVELSLCYDYTTEDYMRWMNEGAKGDENHTPEEQWAV